MAERIPQSVAYLVVFRAYLSADGTTPATGKTIAITISKNGATSFSNPAAGATNATEMASGFYKFTLATGDTGTIGPLAWRGTNVDINDAGDVLSVSAPPKVDVDTIKTNPVVNGGTVTFPTGATLASTTNITAGTIATVSGNVTGSVLGNVDGNVGGNVEGGLLGDVNGDIMGSVSQVIGNVSGDINGDVVGKVLGGGSSTITGVGVNAAIVAANDFATVVAQKLADIILRRNQVNVEGSANGDTLDKQSLYGIIQMMQESDTTTHLNKLTIFKRDGTTELGQITLTSDAAALPITGAH